MSWIYLALIVLYQFHRSMGWTRHLMELYTNNRAQADDAGLALVPRLKYEHVHLTSYSQMRVDLAAQGTMGNTL